MNGPPDSFRWDIQLSAPGEGFRPEVGVHESARRAPFTSWNGLDVPGLGHGCNQLTGRFVVLEAVYGTGGSITRFAADFEQHCNDAAPGLSGAIRYNSTIMSLVPFGGLYLQYKLSLSVPENGQLTGEGITCGGGASACETIYIAATRLNLTATADSGYFFAGWAGDCLGSEAVAVHVNSQKRRVLLPAVGTARRPARRRRVTPTSRRLAAHEQRPGAIAVHPRDGR